MNLRIFFISSLSLPLSSIKYSIPFSYTLLKLLSISSLILFYWMLFSSNPGVSITFIKKPCSWGYRTELYIFAFFVWDFFWDEERQSCLPVNRRAIADLPIPTLPSTSKLYILGLLITIFIYLLYNRNKVTFEGKYILQFLYEIII
jgi:hypothetical protein